jgi:hypothetical protein
MNFLYSKDLLEKFKPLLRFENKKINKDNLKDLDSFLFFLHYNKITHDGLLIVIKCDEMLNINDKNYIPYSKNKQQPYEYYVNQKALFNYFKSLHDLLLNEMKEYVSICSNKFNERK